MIPIDGEKLVDFFEKSPLSIYIKHIVKRALNEGEFNLPPGTLVIQREEGYEKRSCSLCFFASDCCINRCGMAEEWDGECYQVQMTCEGCELQLPCKYHITDSELKAAYIVGGGEK